MLVVLHRGSDRLTRFVVPRYHPSVERTAGSRNPMVEPAHGLSLRNVSKYYGPLAAVDDVSLAVGNGEFLTLLGPSGSGKTTLLMMVAGFTEPSGGTIAIGGRDITRMPPEKRNFGMVFQGYALFPHLTVAQNV